MHAVSDSPLGPFKAASIVMPYHDGPAGAGPGPAPWDRNAMNPKFLILEGAGAEAADLWGHTGDDIFPAAAAAIPSPSNDLFLIYYTGDTFNYSRPNASDPRPASSWIPQATQRIGAAYSTVGPDGPYRRLPAPVLAPAPAPAWDSRMLSNAAVTAMPDGRLLMVYKGSNPPGAFNKQTQVCLGVAIAKNWSQPFVRASADPIIPCPTDTFNFEDPGIWYDRNTRVYHMILKDNAGSVTHAGYSGAHAVSTDGITWEFTDPPLAYLPHHIWSDGKTRAMHRQERPQILIDPKDGSPIAMFFATDTDLEGKAEGLFWNMVWPLREGLV